MKELQKITRKALTKNGHHHPIAAVERIVIARKDGGRRNYLCNETQIPTRAQREKILHRKMEEYYAHLRE